MITTWMRKESTMTPHSPLTPSQSLRVRAAALWMGLMSAGYAGLSALYFYEDVLKHVGGEMMVDATGVGFHIEGTLWTYLSFTRPLMAALAVLMLGTSAVGLWRGRPRARILSLLTLWGLFLPQVLWYTEFLADWHGAQGIPSALGLALAMVAVPSALLMGRRLVRRFEGTDTLTGWATLTYGRARLLMAAVALAWLGFGATSFMDHAERLPSDLAWFGAFMGFVLSGLAVVGIVKLRAWALWVGVAATLFMALIPLASLWTEYVPNLGWHINATVDTLAGTPLQRALWTAVPLGVLWVLAGPFLHEFIRKLRD